MYAIYGKIYHQYTPNVSIYTPYMDPMGMGLMETLEALSKRAWIVRSPGSWLPASSVPRAVQRPLSLLSRLDCSAGKKKGMTPLEAMACGKNRGLSGTSSNFKFMMFFVRFFYYILPLYIIAFAEGASKTSNRFPVDSPVLVDFQVGKCKKITMSTIPTTVHTKWIQVPLNPTVHETSPCFPEYNQIKSPQKNALHRSKAIWLVAWSPLKNMRVSWEGLSHIYPYITHRIHVWYIY